jgi:AcrR family transcriptional regulator
VAAPAAIRELTNECSFGYEPRIVAVREGRGRTAEPIRDAADASPTTPARSTRDLILDAGERLFAERGIEGVAVRDLARETGLTPSSLYNHFPGKQALYDAVLERGLRPIVEMTAEAWRSGPLRPERMRAMLERLVDHLAAHAHLAPLLQRVLLEEAGRSDSRVAVWVRSLSTPGMKLVREAAGAAGWEDEEIPHLTLALFGLTYSYFVNGAAAHAIEPSIPEPFAPSTLAVQKRFLEKATMRLLAPRPRGARPARRRPA